MNKNIEQKIKEINDNCLLDTYKLLLGYCESALQNIEVTQEERKALEVLCFRLNNNDVLAIVSLLYSIQSQVRINQTCSTIISNKDKLTFNKNLSIEDYYEKKRCYEQSLREEK